MRALFSSLRFRLWLLVLLAILPTLATTLYFGLEQRRAAAITAQDQALRLVRLTASEQNALIEGVRQLLITLAQLPQVRDGDPAACQAFLAQLRPQNPAYANLGVIELDGTVSCSALSFDEPINAADRAYFQRAVATGTFTIGEYQIGRITGRPGINFSYPIFGASGNVQGVVFVALDLSWTNELAAEFQLPEGATLTVVDQQGVILARYPQPEQWVGQALPEAPLVQAILGQGEGTTQTLGVDNVERLYAFTPLGRGPESNAYAAVGIPVDVAYAEANQNLVRSQAILALAAALAFGATWVFAELFVLGKIRALLVATRRLAGGDLSARTGVKQGVEELSQLANAFDEMAESLQQQIIRRERMEAVLQNYTIQLERSNRDLQEFAYVASHDLQEPLRKIHAFGDRLSARYAETLGDDGKDYLQRMQSATRRMKILINDLLAYSRVTTRAQPFTPVNLNEVVGEVVSDLEARLEETGGCIEVDSLPTIESDHLQMRQLLQNLIGNALKYHQTDSPPVVKVYAECPAEAEQPGDEQGFSNGYCRLLITDNGIGFDEKYLDRIFQPFRRLYGRAEYEGTGMGLAICRKIVERHNGAITARSAPGQGATFIVTLPTRHSEPEERGNEPSE